MKTPDLKLSRSWKWAIALAVAALVTLVSFWLSPRGRFIAGGALMNLAYRLQDPLEDFTFVHDDDLTPEEVWNEVLAQNELSASVRKQFPRTRRHPVVAMVVCMDARLDTNELAGDTRQYYYTIRTAGSVLSVKEEEMLELAVEDGVKVIVLTTHTDCAAERAARTPIQREHYPNLVAAVDERDMRIAELLARPMIASRVAAGTLLVKQINIDTLTERIVPR